MYGSVKLSPYNYCVPERPLDPPEEEYYEEREVVQCAYCMNKVSMSEDEAEADGWMVFDGDLFCPDCIAELERAAQDDEA